MGQAKDPKSVSIDELRDTTRSLRAWRTGSLVRLARKQTERVLRRSSSGLHPAFDIPPPSKRNRHG